MGSKLVITFVGAVSFVVWWAILNVMLGLSGFPASIMTLIVILLIVGGIVWLGRSKFS